MTQLSDFPAPEAEGSAVTGRPTKATDELLARANDYLDHWQDFGVIPSITALALYLGVSRQTLHNWATEQGHPFFDILERTMCLQEVTALNKGLTGEWNAMLVKLVLGKHGYHDRTETDNTHRGEVKVTRIELVGHKAE